MSIKSFRRAVFTSCAAAALTAFGAPVAAIAQEQTYRFDIPAQDLPGALRAFGRQSRQQVAFDGSTMAGKTSRPLAGSYSAEAGLRTLLDGTGYAPVRGPKGVLMVRVAGGGVGAVQAQGDAAVADEEEPFAVSEIIVTAQKRAERLQDVPVPVTVLDTRALASNGQSRLEDYFTRVPGLNLVVVGNGSAPAINIRGITTAGSSNPTVGIVVDDVPYGSTVNPGTAPVAPDIDPGDLARIEVLRGPQGTLYGASSIGGLLKYITADPSVSGFSGRLQAGISAVDKGEMGYNLRGGMNLPLGETVALRLSAFSNLDPGYVDNVLTGDKDVNRRESKGGRAALLFQPTSAVTIKLSALVQDAKRNGSADIDRTRGIESFQQTSMPGTGMYERRSEAYSATATFDLAGVELVSLTGYSNDRIFTNLDATPFFNSAPFVPGSTGSGTPFSEQTEKLSQELRLSGKLGERVEWLAGLFYTKENLDTATEIYGANLATGAVVGSVLSGTNANVYEERAVFGAATVSLTEQFDIQVGGRLSANELEFAVRRNPGPLFGANPAQPPVLRSDDRPFTYLVTPRFRVTSDLMLYARLASGYRPGGANNCVNPAIPCEYESDTTRNMELGAKGNLFDGLLSFDASVYNIDWRDVQIPVVIAGFQVIGNAGEARSRGVELSLEARPTRQLHLSGWVAWNEAQLAEALPANSPTAGQRGDRLPQSSDWSGSASAEYRFPIGSDANAYVGGTASYVGERLGIFRAANINRSVFPSYTQLDLRAGAEFGRWAVNAYVNNVTNRRGILRDGSDSNVATLVTLIQPRTFGINLSATF